jgi:cytidine deaminase
VIPITDEAGRNLVAAARAATARAFLTAPGGTCNGAAVLTRSGNTYTVAGGEPAFSPLPRTRGRGVGGEGAVAFPPATVYTAGQYSSWNHVTNIHAEQAALLIATMSDDPDVLALATASTGGEAIPRPCGVCRQVMKEHADRTGRDFEVLMAHRHDDGFDRSTVSELLPLTWTARSQAGSSFVSPLEVKYRDADLRPGEAPGGALAVGDHVVLTDGSIAMVWDGRFEDVAALVKIKYAPLGEKGRRKVSHSFTEPLKYQADLHELGWARATATGAVAAVVRPADLQRWLPALPLADVGDRLPGPLLDILGRAGVDLAAIRVTGSRSLGLQHAESDWDLVVPVAPERLPHVRAALFAAMRDGGLKVPTTSGTWKLLDRLFPGGRQALLDQQRFIDTVLSERVPVALILVPPGTPGPLLDESWKSRGRGLFQGRVVAAVQAAYKRARYVLETREVGQLDVVCYHKTANLLREGDRVAVRGWLMSSGQALQLIQILPIPDNIVWHGTP